MTKKTVKVFLYCFCFIILSVGLLVPETFAAPGQAIVKRTCLMGHCWKRIDVNKLGEIGCPAPMLIINNVLRELNGYLAARQRLKLSESQVKQLRIIKYRCHNTLMKKRAELNLLSIDLLDNMSSNQFELAQVVDLTEKLKSTCHGLLSGVIKEVIAARKVLTPEQRKIAKELAY